jgi:hypothetical protein
VANTPSTSRYGGCSPGRCLRTGKTWTGGRYGKDDLRFPINSSKSSRYGCMRQVYSRTASCSDVHPKYGVDPGPNRNMRSLSSARLLRSSSSEESGVVPWYKLLGELSSHVPLPSSALFDEGAMSAAEKQICKRVIKEHQKISFARKNMCERGGGSDGQDGRERIDIYVGKPQMKSIVESRCPTFWLIFPLPIRAMEDPCGFCGCCPRH